MAKIEKKDLAPLDPRIVIGEADRQRIYEVVRQHISGLISGDQSCDDDGVQRSDQARAEALDDTINSIEDMRHQVDDPSDILGSMRADLQRYTDTIKERIRRDAPVDNIELPSALTPQTSDQNSIYVDPDPGPFSPRRPWSPSQRPKELGVSFPVGDDDRTLSREVASSQLGLISGRPMRRLPVGISIFSRS